MTWIVTVPLWRAGKAVPIAERLEQLETFKAMTGDYYARFDTEEKANECAYEWSRALGFSVEAKNRPSPITAEESERIVAEALKISK